MKELERPILLILGNRMIYTFYFWSCDSVSVLWTFKKCENLGGNDLSARQIEDEGVILEFCSVTQVISKRHGGFAAKDSGAFRAPRLRGPSQRLERGASMELFFQVSCLHCLASLCVCFPPPLWALSSKAVTGKSETWLHAGSVSSTLTFASFCYWYSHHWKDAVCSCKHT